MPVMCAARFRSRICCLQFTWHDTSEIRGGRGLLFIAEEQIIVAEILRLLHLLNEPGDLSQGTHEYNAGFYFFRSKKVDI